MYAVSRAGSPDTVYSAQRNYFLFLLLSNTHHHKVVIKINNYVTQYIYLQLRKRMRVQMLMAGVQSYAWTWCEVFKTDFEPFFMEISRSSV